MTKSVVRPILMAMFVIGCGWLVVRTAMINGSDAGTATLVERLAPGNPQISLAIASSEFLVEERGQLVASPAIVRRGHEALRKSPLAAEPFIFAGAAASAAGRLGEGDRLLVEALHRDPRSQLTRMLLYQNHFQRGDYQSGFRELADLARLQSALVPQLAPELAKLASIPDLRAPLLDTLRSHPALHDAMLAQLVRMGTDAQTILALAEPIRPRGAGAPVPAWQGPFLNGLVAKGQLDIAHAAWLRFTNVPASTGIYDAGFARRPGPPPFNWTFANGGTGVAEPAPGGRLAIEYFGRAPAGLAYQLLLLRPGRYAVMVDVSSEESNVETGLDLRLRCASARSLLASTPLPATGGSTKTVQLAFEVPQGCEGQWLIFGGTPRDIGGSSHVTIGGLRLKKVGS